LEALLKAGKITEQDLWAVEKDDNIKLAKICDWFHTIFCEKVHSDECLYYNEQDMTNTWRRPSHQYWLQETAHFIDCLQLLNIGTKASILLDEIYEAIKEEASDDLASLLKVATVYGKDIIDYLVSEYEIRYVSPGVIDLTFVEPVTHAETLVTIRQGLCETVPPAPPEPLETPASSEHRMPPLEAPAGELTQTSTTPDSVD